MSWNILNCAAMEGDLAGVTALKVVSPGLRKVLAVASLFCLAPLVLWMLGTAIVRVMPPVYRSEAVLKLPVATADASGSLRSSAVIAGAASTLAAGETPDPMAKQVLWCKVTLEREIGGTMIQVAARSHDPAEAQRTLMAVVESYEALHADRGQRLLVYASPPDSAPVAVPHGMRMVLGCAGMALVGLLLSIPLLTQLERLSVIARASAATGFPRGGGYLPAAQPAG